MSAGLWLKEHPDSGDGSLTMHRAIEKLRDEITGFAMLAHNGHDRQLSMVMAKLDEAKLWAIEYQTTRGNFVVVDKRQFVPDTTDETGSNA